MDVLQLVLGTLLVLAAVVDALTTTVSVSSGSGALTGRLTGLLWRALVRLHRRDRSGGRLRLGGIALLTTTVLLWVCSLWAGWTLVLIGSPGTVVDSSNGVPASLADTFYYAGFTIFTLGVGDFSATTSTGRILTALASFTGLFLITLAITYLLSVVQAVVARRALAVRVFALGQTANDLVARSWNGSTFSSALVQHLVDLTGQIAAVAEQHLAYPVLHYFHTGERRTSAARALAQLDDALLLLSAAVAPHARPDDSVVTPAREAIGRYVITASLTSATVGATDAPPVPSLDQLGPAGVPVLDAGTLALAAQRDVERRTALHQLVRSDGWSWPTSR